MLRGFAPVYRKDARVLLLGSMPGQASLVAGQYYAHPRNAFWPIMGELFEAGPALPYAARLERLLHAGVALWDVIGSCQRDGSLDSAIESNSIEANDLQALFEACPCLNHVFFNGTAAENAFRRHVGLSGTSRPMHFQRLPSTSPAHAALTFSAKLAAWQAVRMAAHTTDCAA
ncbi:DNA-deoxyinosine glycosylase [Azoarcus sp. L1K30]|uniref:DNA-deoxyinosine glycosylase n=1 Tax=Azoarcus sp. L1K30 TaxID=2820277 RepID=UPI001B8297C5|nr:DNA-deoxyinosine glycosylase [Azoarcus sp. L1K30]MBR0566487.1 DNA-deoxyinosine glycosylase [Azoarcus sp. L1K30]